MKVLLLHQYFNTPQTGGPLRSYFLATALVERGISPIVITTHQEKKYRVGISEGIEVHYLPVPYQNKYGFYRRGWAFVKFAFGILRLARKFRDARLCYAISVPLTVGLAALALKRLYKLPYIFEVGDLWPDAPIELGFIRSPILKRNLYAIERRIYDKAAAIVALSDPIRKKIEARTSGKTVHLIQNMADTVFLKPSEKPRSLKEKFSVGENFVVSYIGAVGYANGLDFYLACAKASQAALLPIQFMLCGAGAMLGRLKQTALEMGLENISFVPFQNRDGVRELMDVTDAVFVCYRPFPILETGSPNKYFDGLAAGKLIIVNFGGWIREEIESVGCGVFVDPDRPDEFISKLRPIIMDKQVLRRYQMASRTLAEQKYSRKMLESKFCEMIARHT